MLAYPRKTAYSLIYGLSNRGSETVDSDLIWHCLTGRVVEITRELCVVAKTDSPPSDPYVHTLRQIPPAEESLSQPTVQFFEDRRLLVRYIV